MDAATRIASVAARPRGFVGVSGPQAGEHLQRMVSNDVLALAEGEACDALLLTPKARIIATLRVFRRGADDFLLLTEPELAPVLRDALLRSRFAARCEIEIEEFASFLAFGDDAPSEGAWLVPNDDYGVPCIEVVGTEPRADARRIDQLLERLRIESGTPLFGHEIDDRVMPAEVGLDASAVSFTKGCFPGQEPVARLRYRGHVNRSLRVLRIEASAVPAEGSEVFYDGRSVGRLTSATASDTGVVALAYIREEVPLDVVVSVLGAEATMSRSARP